MPCYLSQDMDEEDVLDFGYPCVVGTPLLEVFSVSITKTANDDRRSELYGTIRVTNGWGTDFILYDRTHQNSESIKSNGTLSLKGPSRCMAAVSDFTICLNLKDRHPDIKNSSVEDLEISDGKIFWNWNRERMEYYYDKLLSINVPGRHGFATVHFAVFSVAIQAEVVVVLKGINGKQGGDFDSDIYGTVHACYRRSVDYSSSYKREYFRATLFNRSAGNSLKLKPGEPIPLLKSFLAVPAYASLVIEPRLFRGDSNVVILEGATTELLAGQHYETDMEGEKGFIAQVKVRWCRRPSTEEYFKSSPASTQPSRRPPPVPAPLSASSLPQPSERKLNMVRKGFPRFQVFSVSVRRNEHESMHMNVEIDEDGTIKPPITNDVIGYPTAAEKCVKLYGAITLVDGVGIRRFIYNRPKEMPESINRTDDTISLSVLSDAKTCPSTFDLDMRFDLKDADGDVEISRGWLIYDLRDPRYCYSRRLSCVIPGNHGSATVYYMLLVEAVDAYVRVQLLIADDGVDDSSTGFFVSGSLVARYSGHEYSSAYERKYYQIILFMGNPDDDGVSVEVDDGNSSESIVDLPLSSPLLAVPVDTSLIIEADLVVKSGKTEIATVQDTVEFPQEFGKDRTKTIAGKNALLNATVVWSRGRSRCPGDNS